MSELKGVIAYKCRRCGKYVELGLARTEKPDYEGRELYSHLQNFLKNVSLCNDCLMYYNYLAKEGRSDEFWQA
jgi:hypothetical protein